MTLKQVIAYHHLEIYLKIKNLAQLISTGLMSS